MGPKKNKRRHQPRGMVLQDYIRPTLSEVEENGRNNHRQNSNNSTSRRNVRHNPNDRNNRNDGNANNMQNIVNNENVTDDINDTNATNYEIAVYDPNIDYNADATYNPSVTNSLVAVGDSNATYNPNGAYAAIANYDLSATYSTVTFIPNATFMTITTYILNPAYDPNITYYPTATYDPNTTNYLMAINDPSTINATNEINTTNCQNTMDKSKSKNKFKTGGHSANHEAETNTENNQNIRNVPFESNIPIVTNNLIQNPLIDLNSANPTHYVALLNNANQGINPPNQHNLNQFLSYNPNQVAYPVFPFAPNPLYFPSSIFAHNPQMKPNASIPVIRPPAPVPQALLNRLRQQYPNSFLTRSNSLSTIEIAPRYPPSEVHFPEQFTDHHSLVPLPLSPERINPYLYPDFGPPEYVQTSLKFVPGVAEQFSQLQIKHYKCRQEDFSIPQYWKTPTALERNELSLPFDLNPCLTPTNAPYIPEQAIFVSSLEVNVLIQLYYEPVKPNNAIHDEYKPVATLYNGLYFQGVDDFSLDFTRFYIYLPYLADKDDPNKIFVIYTKYESQLFFKGPNVFNKVRINKFLTIRGEELFSLELISDMIITIEPILESRQIVSPITALITSAYWVVKSRWSFDKYKMEDSEVFSEDTYVWGDYEDDNEENSEIGSYNCDSQVDEDFSLRDGANISFDNSVCYGYGDESFDDYENKPDLIGNKHWYFTYGDDEAYYDEFENECDEETQFLLNEFYKCYFYCDLDDSLESFDTSSPYYIPDQYDAR